MKRSRNRESLTPLRVLYYRRRVLFSILKRDGGQTMKIRLQKLLFLFTQGQEQPAYHFLPCQYGCYSFQAAQDAKILAGRYGILTADEQGYSLNPRHMQAEYFRLKEGDRQQLEDTFQQYGHLGKNALIRESYKQHPWYAIHSELLAQPDFADLRALVAGQRPETDEETPVLYTTGYEGDSIERYMARLMKNGISVLLDVRRNPCSMKYGFSRNQLQHIAQACKIRYLSVPELGVEKSRRRHLVSRLDYDALFAEYRASLAQKEDALQRVEEVLHKHSRVVLSCFEKSQKMCHRGVLAQAIKTRCGVSVKHL